MHNNMTVTRTASTGNCTGTSTGNETESAGFPFARRHSSAGIRAFTWATASACSFGSSLGSESRGSKDSIRSIVVTPDSIPQFTIPKLALEDSYRSRPNEKERQSEEEENWDSTDDILESQPPQPMSSSLSSSVSSTSSFGFSPSPGRKLLGGISDHASIKRVPYFSCPLLEAEHCSDPASRAALSLPHLPKVTTPYGFITLSKSPQMASEETLLQTGHRRLPEEISSRHPKLEMKRSVPVRTSAVQIQPSTPPQQSPAFNQQRFFRSHSVTEIEIQRQLAQRKQSRSTNSQAPVTKNKQSLWGVLRKHLKNQKESLLISI